MARVEKSVLVAHPPECMFELVDRVEEYPDFLPWCGGTELKLRDEQRTVATIHIAYLGIHQSFTTENLKVRPREMRIRLQDGPFAELEGDWLFRPFRVAIALVRPAEPPGRPGPDGRGQR